MKSGPKNGKLYTEEDWNTDSEADQEGGYMYSKVLSCCLHSVVTRCWQPQVWHEFHLHHLASASKHYRVSEYALLQTWLLAAFVALASLGVCVCRSLTSGLCMQTVAEKKAWELSEKLGFELVTIMPSLVLGPVTGNRNDGTSLNVMKVRTMLSCKPGQLCHVNLHSCAAMIINDKGFGCH